MDPIAILVSATSVFPAVVLLVRRILIVSKESTVDIASTAIAKLVDVDRSVDRARIARSESAPLAVTTSAPPHATALATPTLTAMKASLVVDCTNGICVQGDVCGTSCANSNECSGVCSTCTNGICVKAAPCGAACAVNSDCLDVPNGCPVCANSVCSKQPPQ
eukprot:TRINITY_DN6075_c0_g1_i2.p2 TRINITY_DN6075_c0_g1~~TRINITY_DN6075_c0_g1_i2.p2  ORF type:complete len:163 (-),score=24.74 TRINITY_DN6075_c0_g1_i2:27-515(-)